jgi:hypothetical protein
MAKRCQIGKTVHILYVDIDTLRADHVGFHGYSRLTAPCHASEHAGERSA